MAPLGDETGSKHILRTARRRFLQWGYSGTSTAALAQDLGITKAALYYHFADKEALFLAVVADYLEELSADLSALSPPQAGGNPKAALEALARVFLDRREGTAQVQQLAFQESRHLSAQAQERLSGLYHQALVTPVSRWLDQAAALGWIGRPAADEPNTIWIFLGLVTAFLQPGHELCPPSPSAPAAFVRLFTRTLKGDSL